MAAGLGDEVRSTHLFLLALLRLFGRRQLASSRSSTSSSSCCSAAR
jgi:hypothetical protein